MRPYIGTDLQTRASMGQVIRRGTVSDVAAITTLTRSAYAK